MLIPDWRSMGLAQLNMLVHCTVHELRAGKTLQEPGSISEFCTLHEKLAKKPYAEPADACSKALVLVTCTAQPVV